jgi:hypothetical protein
MQLYAADFHGLRRSGKSTSRVDLAGWRKDRARMFSKKMVVEIGGEVVTVGAKTIRLEFRQQWASGSYSDVGRKVIVLGQVEPDTWRILSEEMLDSHVTDEPRWLDATARGQFAFVERGAVVLASGGRLCKMSFTSAQAEDERQVTYEVQTCPVAATDLHLVLRTTGANPC